jgi:GTP cyclohydrolase III
MRTSVSILATLFTVIVAIPPAQAQTPHAAPPSAIDAALQQHVNAADADRQAVLQLLERAEVKDIAGQAGFDLRKAATAVATLEGAELANLAAQARQVNEALAGGQSTITISTTLIIIALLVIILIVVAV